MYNVYGETGPAGVLTCPWSSESQLLPAYLYRLTCIECVWCTGECTTFTLNLALQARSRVLGPLSPSFQLVRNLRSALDKFLPDDAHLIASGRLHISLTRVTDKQNIIVSEFTDKNDLMDVSHR